VRAGKETQTTRIAARDQSCDLVANPSTADERLISLVVIDRRPLLRECFVRSLASLSGQSVISFASAEHWTETSDGVSASLLLFCAGTTSTQAETRDEVALLLRSAGHPFVIVVSDDDDLDQMIAMLDEGVRGYVLTSSPLSDVMAAIRLVQAGGIFVPSSSLKRARQSTADARVSKAARNRAVLTPRQAAVLKALSQGKQNKIIAYELCMAESTVKVHVKNMMKKFRATNRTHLAFLAKQARGYYATAEMDLDTALPC
jgi:DNA-binding NarL/FixJ family response regulator